MPMLDRIIAVADPKFIDALAAARSGSDIPVPRQLLRVMAAAGVMRPADVDRLSESQLDRMLENKTPFERIQIKADALAAGIWPRTLPVGRWVG